MEIRFNTVTCSTCQIELYGRSHEKIQRVALQRLPQGSILSSVTGHATAGTSGTDRRVCHKHVVGQASIVIYTTNLNSVPTEIKALPAWMSLPPRVRVLAVYLRETGMMIDCSGCLGYGTPRFADPEVLAARIWRALRPHVNEAEMLLAA